MEIRVCLSEWKWGSEGKGKGASEGAGCTRSRLCWSVCWSAINLRKDVWLMWHHQKTQYSIQRRVWHMNQSALIVILFPVRLFRRKPWNQSYITIGSVTQVKQLHWCTRRIIPGLERWFGRGPTTLSRGRTRSPWLLTMHPKFREPILWGTTFGESKSRMIWHGSSGRDSKASLKKGPDALFFLRVFRADGSCKRISFFSMRSWQLDETS